MKTKYKFSALELKHITLALVALAISFEFVLFRQQIFVLGMFSLKSLFNFFIGSIIAVGVSFVLHELAHKFMAESKGLWAEFRAWPAGLLLAVVMAVFTKGGFVFAAPGATMISSLKTKGVRATKISKKDIGHIGIIGSVVNVIIAAVFLFITSLTGFELAKITSQVNAWLAVFNMIPFGMLDGAKVLFWNKFIWLGFFALCIAIFGVTIII